MGQTYQGAGMLRSVGSTNWKFRVKKLKLARLNKAVNCIGTILST